MLGAGAHLVWSWCVIMTSDRDKLALPRGSEDMRRLIPGAELLMVEQAGHPRLLERSAACDEAIADFAARAVARAMPVGGRVRPVAGRAS